jgi:hypothetical protein
VQLVRRKILTFLTLVGQQNPELLRLINSNQADFLAMMNEPIGEDGDHDHDHDDDEYEGISL